MKGDFDTDLVALGFDRGLFKRRNSGFEHGFAIIYKTDRLRGSKPLRTLDIKVSKELQRRCGGNYTHNPCDNQGGLKKRNQVIASISTAKVCIQEASRERSLWVISTPQLDDILINYASQDQRSREAQRSGPTSKGEKPEAEKLRTLIKIGHGGVSSYAYSQGV
ncbi:hypothetical protein KVV02_000267 [Mortierella alpina]|uniref:Uncharacterized protein n=1 Tax=Mortierella alpina TaxID=64518 RepID=A0A9P8D3F0_MORAP|nr:hypothetical protein KVV02_000267 [Mortierella alpina]